MDRDELAVVRDGLKKLLGVTDDDQCSTPEMVESLGGRGKPLEGISFFYNEGGSPLLGVVLSYGEDIRETPLHKITTDGMRMINFLNEIGISKTPSLFSGTMWG
jgi:hypothetical protein